MLEFGVVVLAVDSIVVEEVNVDASLVWGAKVVGSRVVEDEKVWFSVVDSTIVVEETVVVDGLLQKPAVPAGHRSNPLGSSLSKAVPLAHAMP